MEDNAGIEKCLVKEKKKISLFIYNDYADIDMSFGCY